MDSKLLSFTRWIAAARWRPLHPLQQLAAAAAFVWPASKRRSCCRDRPLGHLWSRLVQAQSQALCWLPAGDCCSPAVVPGGCAASRPCQRVVRERIKAGGAGQAQPRGLPCEGATLVAAAGNVGGLKHSAFVSMASQSGETQRAAALPAAASCAALALPLTLARPCLLRPPAAIHETPFGEFIPLSDQAGVPVLVRLHERQWGALARLPAAKLTEAGYEGAHVRAAESHLLGYRSRKDCLGRPAPC